MSKTMRLIILAAVLVAAAFAIYFRGSSEPPSSTVETMEQGDTQQVATAALPKLLDLGSTTCIPCKKMEPILANLSEMYAGQLEVEFINIHENKEAAYSYGIRLIPTQIFFDAEGLELFRHEGFFSEADILAKWKELGVSLVTPGQS